MAAERAPLNEAKRTFALDILPYIVGLAILIGTSLIQLTFGLRPLPLLKERLDRIRERRERRERRLDGVLPREFDSVETALIRLLDSQSEVLAKAGARAGDLAHDLKTPPTALANNALTPKESEQGEIAREIEHLVEQMRLHVERELARSRTVASAEIRQTMMSLCRLATTRFGKSLLETGIVQRRSTDWMATRCPWCFAVSRKTPYRTWDPVS